MDKEPYIRETGTDTCVCCGRIVPEGRMICWECEHECDPCINNENVITLNIPIGGRC